MFTQKEKKPVINIILWFLFLDLPYQGKIIKPIIQFLLFIFGNELRNGTFDLGPGYPFLGTVIIFGVIIWRIQTLFKYIKEYELLPGR